MTDWRNADLFLMCLPFPRQQVANARKAGGATSVHLWQLVVESLLPFRGPGGVHNGSSRLAASLAQIRRVGQDKLMAPLPRGERIRQSRAKLSIQIVAPKAARIRTAVVRKRSRSDKQRDFRLA